jgi:hypothetical protein
LLVKFPKIKIMDNIKQLIISSGNYIEVNEALSKKDFDMRIKICKKKQKKANAG